MKDYINQLGGFAENPEDIDGTIRDWQAFNFCLAEEYMIAMQVEDFESIGHLSCGLVDDIVHWLNYDGTIGKSIANDLKLLPKGLIKTSNNRTFADVVIEKKESDYAEVFILNGNHDPRLYLTCLLSEEYEYGYLFNLLVESKVFKDKESYDFFLNEIFKGIQLNYDKISNNEDKITFLKRITERIKYILYPKKYGSLSIENCDYPWIKQLKK